MRAQRRYGPVFMWVHNTCEATAIPVGPEHMGAYCTCGPIIHVVPQYMLAYCTCRPTIHEGPNSCGPTIRVSLRNMWAYCTIGPNGLGANMYSRPTYIVDMVGPHLLWA